MAEGKQAFLAIDESLRGLQQRPGDPALNEAIGRYYCLDKGDWEQGLPKLAAGGDAQLKTLAATELAVPQDAHARLDLANAWWDLAEGLDPAQRRRVRLHAAQWYQEAAKGLTGLSQTKAQQRSAEAQREGGDRAIDDTADKWDNLQCRNPHGRPLLLKRFGGDEASEVAVDHALGWLERHQNADGTWKFNHNGPRCRGLCPDPGSLNATNAATAPGS